MFPDWFSAQNPLDVFDAIFDGCPENAVIALGSRRPEKGNEPFPHYLVPVRVGERHSLLPGIFEYLVEQTQYFCPDAFHERIFLQPPSHYIEALQTHKPKYFPVVNNLVSHLAALFVDLDVGRDNTVNAGVALGITLDAALNGIIPVPSFGALSGRGAYLLWVLRDTTGNNSPENTDDNCTLWQMCIRGLISRCASLNLKPDRKATRLCNWFKRPGTFDTKTGNEVIYTTFGVDSRSNIPVYTLPKLMNILSLHSAVSSEIEKPVIHDYSPSNEQHELEKCRKTFIPIPRGGISGKPRNSQRGQGSQPSRTRFIEIESLNQHRGGFREGCRYNACWYYFHALREYKSIQYGSGNSQRAFQEAVEETKKFNQTFHPPLSDGELHWVFCGCKRLRVRNSSVVDVLSVTEKEADVLDLHSLCPPALKRERAMKTELECKEKRLLREKRRQIVDEMLKKGKRGFCIVEDCLKNYPELRITRRYVSERKAILEKFGSLLNSTSPFFFLFFKGVSTQLISYSLKGDLYTMLASW